MNDEQQIIHNNIYIYNNNINIEKELIKEKITKNNPLQIYYKTLDTQVVLEPIITKVGIIVQIESIQNETITVNDLVFRYVISIGKELSKGSFSLFSVIEINSISFQNERVTLNSFTTLNHLDSLLADGIIFDSQYSKKYLISGNSSNNSSNNGSGNDHCNEEKVNIDGAVMVSNSVESVSKLQRISNSNIDNKNSYNNILNNLLQKRKQREEDINIINPEIKKNKSDSNTSIHVGFKTNRGHTIGILDEKKQAKFDEKEDYADSNTISEIEDSDNNINDTSNNNSISNFKNSRNNSSKNINNNNNSISKPLPSSYIYSNNNNNTIQSLLPNNIYEHDLESFLKYFSDDFINIDIPKSKVIQKYIINNFNQINHLLNNFPSPTTETDPLFSKLLFYFNNVESRLINDKIVKFLNNNSDKYNSNNNSNNKQRSLYKLLSIYILSVFNCICKKYFATREFIVRDLYSNIILEISNNGNCFEHIIFNLDRIFLKQKYWSINNHIQFLYYTPYQVQVNKRKENIINYQISNLSQDSFHFSLSKKGQVFLDYLDIIKSNSGNNNKNNNPYNSNEIIKIYDQEVYKYKFFLKPELYCNRDVFNYQISSNKDEQYYKNFYQFEENIFHEAPSIGNYSINPSLELFKLCFEVFSGGAFNNFQWNNYDDGQQSSQNIDYNTKVIVSGGSITASIDTLPITIKKEFIYFKRIERLFYKSKLPVIVTKKLMKDIFDVSVLKDYLFTRYFDPISPYFESDVDIWIVSNNLENARVRLYQSIDQVVNYFKSINPFFENNHIFIRTANAVTLVQPYPYRKIQFIIRVYSSVDQLLSSFDIDCVRVFYDGTNVFMHKDTVDSFNKRYSILSKEMCGSSRLTKYLIRGFKIFGVENSYLDPSMLSKYRNIYRDYTNKENLSDLELNWPNLDSHSIFQNYSKSWSFEHLLEHLKQVWERERSYLISMSKDPVFLIETDSNTLYNLDIFGPNSPYLRSLLQSSQDIVPRKQNPLDTGFIDPLSKKVVSIDSFNLIFQAKCDYCGGYYNWLNNNCCNFIFHRFDLILYDTQFRNLLNFKYVLILGGRNPLGFRLAAKLLNYGFSVIVTTRFPQTTKQLIVSKFKRYSFNLKRLHIIKIDFNDQAQHSQFIQYIKSTIPSLDIIINTIQLSNNSINQNYQDSYDQLLSNEISIINSKNNSSDNYEINIVEITEIKPPSVALNEPEELKSVEPSSSIKANILINDTFILNPHFLNYMNYQLPNIIIDQLKSKLGYSKSNFQEEEFLRNSLNIHDDTPITFNGTEFINHQEIFSLLREASSFTFEFLDTIVFYDINGDPNKDIEELIHQFNYEKVSKGFRFGYDDDYSIKDHIVYLSLNKNQKTKNNINNSNGNNNNKLSFSKYTLKKKLNNLYLKHNQSAKSISIRILKDIFRNYFNKYVNE